jgi:hypothetical protein
MLSATTIGAGIDAVSRAELVPPHHAVTSAEQQRRNQFAVAARLAAAAARARAIGTSRRCQPREGFL